MVIQIDTREKAHAIQGILKTFEKAGVQYFSSKCFVGDYVSLDKPRLSVDRKLSLLELCMDIGKDHDRFIAELKRAKQYGIRLIVLCEHGRDITCLEDVRNWKNPVGKISGQTLYKTLRTLSERYDVGFMFCSKSETGRMIIDILNDVAGREGAN